MKYQNNFSKIGRLLTTLIVIPWLTACASSVAPPSTHPEIEKPSPGVMQLELAYVSGHLGNGGFCSDSTPNETGQAADMERMPCHPDDEDCPELPPSCMEGQVTLQLRNLGTTTITGVEVSDLEMLKVDEEYIKGLDIKTVKRADGLDFDGTLEPGAIIQLRVVFSGWSGQGAGEEARIHIIVVEEFGQTSEITTPPIQTLPNVAT